MNAKEAGAAAEKGLDVVIDAGYKLIALGNLTIGIEDVPKEYAMETFFGIGHIILSISEQVQSLVGIFENLKVYADSAKAPTKGGAS